MYCSSTSHEPRLTPNICAPPDLTAANCDKQDSAAQCEVAQLLRVSPSRNAEAWQGAWRGHPASA